MARYLIESFGNGESSPLPNWFLSEPAMCPAVLHRSGRVQEASQNVESESGFCGYFAGSNCQDHTELGTGSKQNSICIIQAFAGIKAIRAAGQGLGRLGSSRRHSIRSKWSLFRFTKPFLSGAGLFYVSAMARDVQPYRQEQKAFYRTSISRFARIRKYQNSKIKASSDCLSKGGQRVAGDLLGAREAMTLPPH